MLLSDHCGHYSQNSLYTTHIQFIHDTYTCTCVYFTVEGVVYGDVGGGQTVDPLHVETEVGSVSIMILHDTNDDTHCVYIFV